MPELPEVETVVRGLRRPLTGRTFTGATVRWPRIIAHPSADLFPARIGGRCVVAVKRRGKYIAVELDHGWLFIHLRMSGRLRIASRDEPLAPHTHVILDLDDGRQLRFHDVRKFGRIHLVDDASCVIGRLGPEPLAEEFTLEAFRRQLERRSGRLKSLLLNQRFLAGLGNIYADEVLFAARLHPLRRADSLSPTEQARLYEAIRSVLQSAVAERGTTLDDGGYVDVQGRAGRYRSRLAVYKRGGRPCVACGTPVERIVVGGRSTHFCPRCQR